MRLIINILTLFLICLVTTNNYSQCTGTVTVPDDITICSPEEINLLGQINGNALSFSWSGTNGFFTNSDLSPSVLTNQTTTYVLTAQVAPTGGPNLIVNGNFESGNTGFTTQYTYVGTPGPTALWNEGRYTVATNPNNYHSDFDNCGDHTSGVGRMMILNGDDNLSIIWCQDINVVPNTYYVFDAWATSVTFSNPAILQFSIDNVLIGSPFDLSSNTCDWQNFNSIWFSGVETNVQICVTDQNTQPSGNDFALDDISFRKACEDKDSFKVFVSEFDIDLSNNGVIDCINTSAEISVNASPSTNSFTYDWSSFNGNFTTSSDPTLINIQSGGTYSVFVTDQFNCSRETSITVFDNIILPVADLKVSDTLSCDVKEVTILNLTNNFNYEYQWTGPFNFKSDEQNPTVKNAGTYTLEILDQNNGCISTFDIEVLENKQFPIINISNNGPFTCSKDSVIIAVADPINNYNYTWSGPNTNVSNVTQIKITQPGTYNLLVENQNGCKTVEKVIVTSIPSALDTSIVKQNIFNCLIDSVELLLPFKGIIDSVFWSNKATFKSNKKKPFIKQTGEYFVMVKDKNDCFLIDTITIGKDKEVIIPSAMALPVNCLNGEGQIIVNDTSRLSALKLLETNSTVIPNQNVIVKQNGFYNIEVTSNNGCKDTFAIEVKRDEDFITNVIKADTITCLKNTIDIDLKSSDVAASYEWTGKNINNSNVKNLKVTQPGIYKLKTVSPKGCVSEDSIEVKIDTISPRFDVDLPSINCINPIAKPTITSSNNYSYRWKINNGVINQGIPTALSQAGIYTFYAVAKNGCETSKIDNLESDFRLPKPIVSGIEELNCKKEFLTLKADGNDFTNVVWKGNNLNNTGSSSTINTIGKYKLISNHKESGCKDSIDFEVKGNFALPLISKSGKDTINCKENAVIKTSVTPNGSTGAWYDSFGKQINYSIDQVFKNQGNYYFVAKHPTSFCEDTVYQDIKIDTIKPQLAITAETITCKNTSSEITVNSDPLNQFTFNNVAISKVNGLTYTTKIPGKYKLTTTSKNGCSAEREFNIDIDTLAPSLQFTYGKLDCTNEPINIAIKEKINVLFGLTFKNQKLFESKGLSNSETLIKVIEAGNYKLNLENNINGCQKDYSFAIEKINDGPQATNFDLPFSCKNYGNTFLLKNIQPSGNSYKVYIDEKLIENPKNEIQLSAGNHNLKVINEKGCALDTNFVIDAFERPRIELDSLVQINYGDTKELGFTSTLSKENIKEIEWFPTDFLSCSNCENPTTTAENDITYNVKLTDNYGCEIESDIRVTVKYIEEVFFPNIISSSSASNGLFYPSGKSIEIVDYLRVYDRWGNLVFSRNNFIVNEPSEGWDGTMNNSIPLQGVYTYVCKMTSIKKNELIFSGDVTVIGR